MSPRAFEQLLGQLTAEIEECDNLCQAIRRNRCVGSTTTALDGFQLDLLSMASKLNSKYREYRVANGSRMETGDDQARSELNNHIRDLQLTIQSRLLEIANNRIPRNSNGMVSPHFGQLHERYLKICSGVATTINSLGIRFRSEKAFIARPEEYRSSPEREVRRSYRAEKVPRSDESIVLNRDLEKLVAHMKNSWVEIEDRSGRLAWENAFDSKILVHKRPSGFIKQARHVRIQEPSEAGYWSGSSRGW